MPIPNIAAHMAKILQLRGVPVSFGASSTYGIPVITKQPFLNLDGGFQVPSYEQTLWIVPGTLGAIQTDSVIVLNGVNVRVVHIGKNDDRGLQPVSYTEEK